MGKRFSKPSERLQFEEFIVEVFKPPSLEKFIKEHGEPLEETIINPSVHIPETRWEKRTIDHIPHLFLSHRKFLFHDCIAYSLIFKELEHLKEKEYIWHCSSVLFNNI